MNGRERKDCRCKKNTCQEAIKENKLWQKERKWDQTEVLLMAADPTGRAVTSAVQSADRGAALHEFSYRTRPSECVVH